MSMGAKSSQLSFAAAVRLGARVPMLASLLTLAVIGVAGQAGWPYVESIVRGTPVATAAHLSSGHRGPVSVVVDGLVSRTTQSPPDALVVVSSAQHLVALDRVVVRPGEAVWGRLRPLTLLEQVRLPVQPSSGFGSTGDDTPRFILDTDSPTRTQLQATVGVVAAAALGAAVTMLRALRHACSPMLGPAGRSLARFGAPNVVRDAFDAAMRGDHAVSGRLHLPEGFVGFRTRNGFSVLPRDDVMWVREGLHPEPTFLSALCFPILLIQSLTSNALFVHDRGGSRTRIAMSSRKERHTVVRELQSAVPHAIFAEDAATRSFWRRHRARFVAAVDERRAFHESFRSNGFVGPEVDVRTAWGLAPDEVDDELFEAAEAKLRSPMPDADAGRVSLLRLTSSGEPERSPDDETHLTVTFDITGIDALVHASMVDARFDGSVHASMGDARFDGPVDASMSTTEITVKRALTEARAQASH